MGYLQFQRLVSRIGVCWFLTWFMASAAMAQWQPTKPIRVVIPFAPGGAADASIRALTDRLQPRFKQPIIIESKPGAGQMIAAEAVSKMEPDGHSILWASSTLVVSPLLTDAKFDVRKELVPVIHMGEATIMLAVHPDLPVNSMGELIAYLKSNPGKVSYGFAGNGSSMHLAGELIKARAGVEMTAVPYRGSAQLLPDLLTGRVQVAVDAITTLRPHVDAGKLKILAVMNGQRSSEVPNVPTMAELGYQNFAVAPWVGFFLPAGTPPDVVSTWNREIDAIVRTPEFAQTVNRLLGLVTRGGTAEQFGVMLNLDVTQTANIIKSAGIKAQ
jgi:tripartite-type tricarboxylate transporter receptor subunit TctC